MPQPAITVAALTGLSALAFGWDTWQAFFAAAANARHVYEAGISQAGLTSPFGVVLVLGGRPALAYQVQAAATLMAMASVGVVWWRGSSQPVRAAMLTAATPIALPVVQFYDLMLSGIALAWLVQLGQQRSLSAMVPDRDGDAVRHDVVVGQFRSAFTSYDRAIGRCRHLSADTRRRVGRNVRNTHSFVGRNGIQPHFCAKPQPVMRGSAATPTSVLAHAPLPPAWEM